MDLNEDCLFEICKYLTLSETFDVMGIFDARFDEVALQRIATFKEFSFSFRECCVFTSKQLNIIGRNLRSINLAVGYSINTQKVLEILKPLCASGAGRFLHSISLNYVNFDIQFLNCLREVATQLTVLNLSFCQLTDALLKPLLEQCKNLRELHTEGNYTLCGESLHAINMNMLETLYIELHEDWTFNINMHIAKLHPHIRVVVYAKGRETQTVYGVHET